MDRKNPRLNVNWKCLCKNFSNENINSNVYFYWSILLKMSCPIRNLPCAFSIILWYFSSSLTCQWEIEFKDHVFHPALFIIFLAVPNEMWTLVMLKYQNMLFFFQHITGGLLSLVFLNWHMTNLFIAGIFYSMGKLLACGSDRWFWECNFNHYLFCHQVWRLQ